MLKYICLLALTVAGVSSMELNNITPFEHKFEFTFISDKYIMQWNHTRHELIVKVESPNTPGWLSFGLSPTGSVYNTDFVLAWSDATTGAVIFKDCYNKENKTVYVDSKPKWTLRFSDFSTTTKTIIFSRYLDVCYGPNEVVVSPTNKVIFSKGSTYESDGFPKYSDSWMVTFTSMIVPLLGKLNGVTTVKSPSSFEEIVYTDNSAISANASTLNCRIFTMPDSFKTTKRHLIGYQTEFNPATSAKVKSQELKLCSNQLNTVPAAGDCLSTAWTQARALCRNVVLVWTAGGDQVVTFPTDKAYPLGGDDFYAKYLMLETHLYSSTSGNEGATVDSGFRLFTTQVYRPIEFGVLTAQMDDDFLGILVPPMLEHLEVRGLVRDAFLKQMGEINVFATQSTVLRDGVGTAVMVLSNKTAKDISVNMYTDTKAQYIDFHKTVAVKDGDEVLFSCTYNTKRNTPLPIIGSLTAATMGGYGEQCKHHLWYYPIKPVQQQKFLYKNKMVIEDWTQLFLTLNGTGKINWTWNGEMETLFSSAFAAFMTSPMAQDMVASEMVLQSFFNTAQRSKLADYELIDTDAKERIPEFTRSVECRTLAMTTMNPMNLTTMTTAIPGTTTTNIANRIVPMVLPTVFMASLFRFIL